MTREEAIRILDPETAVEELSKIEYYGGFGGRTKAAQALSDACILAVAATREQEERSKPKEEQPMDVREKATMIKYTCGAGTPEEAETNCTYFIGGECTASFCEYRRKKQTNADRIRAMNDEELAEFLINLADDGNLKIREWLQQPAEGE